MGKKATKGGRQSLYTKKIATEICDLLIEGQSMRQICSTAGMPNRNTVVKWMEKDPAFEARCVRAREWQAEYMDDLILDTANACTPETAQADRVKISAYQWRASKLKPKVYGDRHKDDDKDGDNNVTIKIVGGLPE